jgi:hypothetical protein
MKIIVCLLLPQDEPNRPQVGARVALRAAMLRVLSVQYSCLGGGEPLLHHRSFLDSTLLFSAESE